MYRRLSKTAHKAVGALVCAVAILAGCHSNNLTSGYGIAWITFTDEPGDYSAYIVTIDSVTLTRSDGAVVTAIATPEIIDFTQLDRYAEMWGSSAIPTGTYVSATITFDYTNAFIAAQVNGQPQKATILDYSTRNDADHVCHHGGFRPRESTDHHADLCLDERRAAGPRFRSGGLGHRGSYG